MKKQIVMIGGGSALLVLCLMIGAFFAGPLMALAQSTTPTTSAATMTNSTCQLYQQNLASTLHISTTTLHQDQVTAREAVIAQEVKEGQLTQAQATAKDKKLSTSQACSGNTGLQRGILRQTLIAEKATLVSQIAPSLHLSTAQLMTDLQNGQTLTQIAKAQKVTKSQLHTIVLNAMTTALDQAQKAGTITAKQESMFVTDLKNHPGVVNHWLHHNFAKVKK